MAAERKPTVPRRRAVLERGIVRDGKRLPAGSPVPDDLTGDEKQRLKRIGAIK